MCGIVGFKVKWDFREFERDMASAVACLRHRGPDDHGIYFDKYNGIGLGHSRLSVIDLSKAGRQPMSNENGNIQVVYNGEIYNFLEIRTTLENLGHTFKTNSDTEVLLRAYEHWGIECLNRFIGMFAFGIWDRQKQRLFLARDRLGIKPLYYYLDENYLIFGSELKAIMSFSKFPKQIDPDAISLFLHYQYIPAPKTIFLNTYKLDAGCYAIFERNGMQIKPYWTIPPICSRFRQFKGPEKEAVEELDKLLTTVVSDHLISDVPLGALLSGGIDSSLVAALMQKVSSGPVRTYTIGFSEEKYNEAPWARSIAEYLGTEHTEFIVTPKEALDVIPRLAELYDEPFADSSAIPTYLVCSLAKSRVTVALSGDGGDEQFAGYVRYWAVVALLQKVEKLPKKAKTALGRILKMFPSSWVEKAYLPLRDHLPQRFRVANFGDKWDKLINLIEYSSLESLYRMAICIWPQRDVMALLGRDVPKSKFEDIFGQNNDRSPLAKLMRVDQHTYLVDAMLTKVDRASMGVSLEVRVPLLDHRVVEFTWRLPDKLKYKNGEGKHVLKNVLSRYLPVSMFQRPKMGFGVPIGQWFRNELKDLITDYLSAESLRKEGLFNWELINQKINEHFSGKVDHQYRLWAILMWEMWRERWL
ncbi:MAG: asparagine synthase (glutamine-hydrolyzing) [Deltaproteobacteria bacterium]|nr:asparagine synthase (glutamine-hydrolyzing) [Deltaproteobacteria bacterium]